MELAVCTHWANVVVENKIEKKGTTKSRRSFHFRIDTAPAAGAVLVGWTRGFLKWRHCLIDSTLNKDLIEIIMRNISHIIYLIWFYRGPQGAGIAGRVSRQIDVTARQATEIGYRTSYWHIQIKAFSSPTGWVSENPILTPLRHFCKRVKSINKEPVGGICEATVSHFTDFNIRRKLD